MKQTAFLVAAVRPLSSSQRCDPLRHSSGTIAYRSHFGSSHAPSSFYSSTAMSATAAAVRTRVLAASKIMVSLDPHKRAATSRVQAEHVVGLLHKGRFQLEDLQEILEAIEESNFEVADIDIVKTCIGEIASGNLMANADVASTCNRQNWVACVNFLTEEVWLRCGDEPEVLCQ